MTELKDFDRIYAMVINYSLEHGHKPELLNISLDKYFEYSKEMRKEIRNLGLEIEITTKPYVFKVK